jgi:hypothetical protein
LQTLASGYHNLQVKLYNLPQNWLISCAHSQERPWWPDILMFWISKNLELHHVTWLCVHCDMRWMVLYEMQQMIFCEMQQMVHYGMQWMCYQYFRHENWQMLHYGMQWMCFQNFHHEIW